MTEARPHTAYAYSLTNPSSVPIRESTSPFVGGSRERVQALSGQEQQQIGPSPMSGTGLLYGRVCRKRRRALFDG